MQLCATLIFRKKYIAIICELTVIISYDVFSLTFYTLFYSALTPTTLSLQNLLIPASSAAALKLIEQKSVKTEPPSPHRKRSADSEEEQDEGDPPEKKSKER